MRNDRNHSSIFWDRLEVPLGRGKDKTDSSLAKIDPIARADLGVGPGGLRPPFVVYQTFQHYMFNIGSRHLLNCISENFNLENFSGGACPRNSLEKCSSGRFNQANKQILGNRSSFVIFSNRPVKWFRQPRGSRFFPIRFSCNRSSLYQKSL